MAHCVTCYIQVCGVLALVVCGVLAQTRQREQTNLNSCHLSLDVASHLVRCVQWVSLSKPVKHLTKKYYSMTKVHSPKPESLSDYSIAS